MNNINNTGNLLLEDFNVYQAANADAVAIKKNFIVRQEELKSILDPLVNRKEKDPLQHELILGRRGSGKSTLLKRIEIEIKDIPKLSKRYIPINLAEEQAGIYRLFDLWIEVISELKYHLKSTVELKEYSEFDDDRDYTKYLYGQIHQLCKQNKKQIVLLLDNFDRIVENFTDDGNMLRETLINYNDIQIIGGSTRMDEHFWKYDMPFYDFFRVHHLGALTSDEVKELLLHWSKELDIPALKDFINNNPGKLENIRILTDGLPRTLQFFVQMVLQQEDSKSYDYLRKIMDNVSPLFQERLNSLTAPMRKTVLEMAFLWEACSTKQLVEVVKMESKLVSANLKTLTEKGIVEKIETGTKNHLYRIAERFFNLWIIITQGNPEQKRKARWLSIYLEAFYDEKEIQDIYEKQFSLLKENKVSWEDVLIVAKGLAQSKHSGTIEKNTKLKAIEKIEPDAFKMDSYFDNFIKKGSETELRTAMLLLHEKNQDKDKALQISRKLDDKLWIITIEIWNGKFDNTEKRIANEFKKRNFEDLSYFIVNLLIHQQTNLSYSLFHHPEFGKILQEKYLILYYATSLLTQKNDENLSLRIPPELNETIEKLMARINEKEIFYGYKKGK